MKELKKIMKNQNNFKTQIAAEYIKRKYYRKIAEFFKSFILSYEKTRTSEKILNEEDIINEFNDYLMQYSKAEINNTIKEIYPFIIHLNNDDYNQLSKKIYHLLPEFRDEFNKNPIWIIKQITTVFSQIENIYKQQAQL
jgi:hypothetical protein